MYKSIIITVVLYFMATQRIATEDGWIVLQREDVLGLKQCEHLLNIQGCVILFLYYTDKVDF